MDEKVMELAFFDDLETRSADERAQAQLDGLRRQIDRARAAKNACNLDGPEVHDLDKRRLFKRLYARFKRP